MIPYILYVSIILSVCLIFYKLLLQKETFFSLNRFVLLSCMVVAFVLPLVRVPPQLSFRQAPVTVVLPAVQTTGQQDNTATTVADPPARAADAPIAKSFVNAEAVMQWLVYLYWFGVLLFGLNFLMQIVILLYRAYSGPVIIDGKFRIVEMTGDKAPCSFANTIFINPERYDWETYNQILLHEKIHIEQKHTLDLLLAEIVLIFQWFNPFAWQWRKALESNLEFFTDAKMLRQEATEKEQYQLSLLRVAAPHFPLSLTTNYNQSLLKKRLLMMNSKKSNVHTTWKYFFLLPMMVLLVCFFNEPMAQQQRQGAAGKSGNSMTVNDDMKTSGYWFATIREDKVNIQFGNDDGHNNNSSGTSFRLDELGTLPVDKQGTFTLTRDAGTMEFTGKFEGNKGMGNYKFIPNKNYNDEMRREGIALTRDQDLMVFFLVNVKLSHVAMLKRNGYTDLDKDNIIPIVALDVNEAYISSIKAAGFNNISLDNLIPFKALNIDKAYIDEIRNAGYKNLTPDKIITFKAQGIDGKYITDFRGVLKDSDTGSRRNTGTTKDADKDQDDKDDEDKMIAFKAMNIDKEFAESFKVAGLTNIDNSDLIAMKSLGVTAEYMKGLQNAGYPNIATSDVIAMKSLGVTPEYIKSFRDAGYADIKVEDMIALKSQQIAPALLKEYKDLGFNDLDIGDVIGAKATGTTPAFIKSMREKGHNLKSLEKYIALKSVIGH
jgi:hypothetical protein